jgi:hypothetical protein
LDTVDFESVIHALEGGAIVSKAYGDDERHDLFRSEIEKIKLQLVHAIRKTHPSHREEISEQFESSRLFLNNFIKYFTLNYDLLLYWIQLDTKSYKDGFGLGKEENGFRGPFKADAYCNTYNIHGGLHLFLDQVGEVQKILMGDSGVIDAIAAAITEHGRLPLYVAEGTWQAKLAKINSVGYLRSCLSKLGECGGDMFILGHSANESDSHIYNTLFRSNIEHIYFGIYEPNEDKIREFDARLSKFQKSNGSNIQYTFYNSGSANIWKS